MQTIYTLKKCKLKWVKYRGFIIPTPPHKNTYRNYD